MRKEATDSKGVAFKPRSDLKGAAFVAESTADTFGVDWGDIDGDYSPDDAETDVGTVCGDEVLDSVISYEDLESLEQVCASV